MPPILQVMTGGAPPQRTGLSASLRWGSIPKTMPMKTALPTSLLLAVLTVTSCHAEEVIFRDDFQGKLAEGWSWIREDRAGWRVTAQGLEVRVQPGNM